MIAAFVALCVGIAVGELVYQAIVRTPVIDWIVRAIERVTR